MSSGWLREAQADLAAEKILDAASAAFAERGVARTGMADIARAAGCSRGTVYRYFRSRSELHSAYVNRWAQELASRVAAGLAGIEDPHARLVEGILGAVREVRATPATAAWFAPGDVGIAAGMSRASEGVEALATAFVAPLSGARDDDRENRLRARWLVRIVVSLLSVPGESEREERELVERFAAPALVGAAPARAGE